MRYLSPTDCMLYWTPGDEWSWAEEFVNLAEQDGQQLIDFCQLIKKQGIKTPIVLGHDGRVWDGHHRIFAALTLGLVTIPFIYPEEQD